MASRLQRQQKGVYTSIYFLSLQEGPKQSEAHLSFHTLAGSHSTKRLQETPTLKATPYFTRLPNIRSLLHMIRRRGPVVWSLGNSGNAPPSGPQTRYIHLFLFAESCCLEIPREILGSALVANSISYTHTVADLGVSIVFNGPADLLTFSRKAVKQSHDAALALASVVGSTMSWFEDKVETCLTPVNWFSSLLW